MPKPIIGIPKVHISRPPIGGVAAAGRWARARGGAAQPPAPPEPVAESRVLPTLGAALWAAAAVVAAYAAVTQLNDADTLSFAGRENEVLYWLGGADFAVTAAGLWFAWHLFRAPTRRTLGYSGVIGAIAAIGAVVMLAFPEAPRDVTIAGVLALGAAGASLLARREVPAAAEAPTIATGPTDGTAPPGA